jgi:hypothetical protein
MSDPRPTPVPPRRLPQQPNLEQLKKQAKELLERFRASELTAIAEVRQFERSPDPSRFALNDAQRVLARAYGFESWPKLKAFVDGATIARFADAVKAGDMVQVRSMLASRPELVSMDRAGNDEHRGLHYAVLSRNAPMVKLLLEAGADARKSVGGFTSIAFDESQPVIQMDFDGKPMLYESCKVYFHVIYVMIPNPGTVLEHLNDAARSTCREQGTDCQFPSWILL